MAWSILQAEVQGVADHCPLGDTECIRVCMNTPGASGETGCWQRMPGRWETDSRRVLGYVATRTPVNEAYVTVKMMDEYLVYHTPAQISQIWNTGRAGPCIKGVNKKGIPYDSCKYEKNVLAMLSRQ